MPKAIIIYYSRSGNTKQMAQLVAEGFKKEGVDVTVKDVLDTGAD